MVLDVAAFEDFLPLPVDHRLDAEGKDVVGVFAADHGVEGFRFTEVELDPRLFVLRRRDPAGEEIGIEDSGGVLIRGTSIMPSVRMV